MRHLLLLCALAAPLSASAAPSPGGPLGLGIGGGYGVSGLSGKLYLSDANALQLTFGWWGVGRDNSGAGVGLDYLFERPAFHSAGPVDLGWNFGLGASAAGSNDWDGNNGRGGRLGVSGILALEILVQPVPVDIVLEVRPGLSLIPDLEPDFVNFGGHIRYYF